MKITDTGYVYTTHDRYLPAKPITTVTAKPIRNAEETSAKCLLLRVYKRI